MTSQGQARGYGHITPFGCNPHGANTSNLNDSLMAQYFWKLFSACKNLGFLWLFAVGSMNIHQIIFNWELFEKKFSNICFQHNVKKSGFRKNVKKYSTLTMPYDQTTPPTIEQKVSLERWYPYLLYDNTLGVEKCLPAGSQWPRKNHGPIWAEAKS